MRTQAHRLETGGYCGGQTRITKSLKFKLELKKRLALSPFLNGSSAQFLAVRFCSQHDRRRSAGPAQDHGDLLKDHALRARLQRLRQDHRAHPVALRGVTVLQADGRADPGPAAGSGGEGGPVGVGRRAGGGHLHRPGRHETGEGVLSRLRDVVGPSADCPLTCLQALNNLQSTNSGFGYINSENVFKVCDEPHPLLVKSMLGHCVDGNIDEAYKVVEQLWALGYSPEDIIGNIFRVCKTYQMAEYLKLEFIKVRRSHAHTRRGSRNAAVGPVTPTLEPFAGAPNALQTPSKTLQREDELDELSFACSALCRRSATPTCGWPRGSTPCSRWRVSWPDSAARRRPLLPAERHCTDVNMRWENVQKFNCSHFFGAMLLY